MKTCVIHSRRHTALQAIDPLPHADVNIRHGWQQSRLLPSYGASPMPSHLFTKSHQDYLDLK